MSDEIQKGETPAETQAVEEKDIKNTAPDSAEKDEAFDKDRAMNTIHSLREDEKQWKKDRKELERLKAEEAKRKEAEMTEAEKLKARADQLEAELQRERSEKMRLKVASKYSLPDALSARLIGDTEEELEEDAKRLAEFLPKKEQKKPELNANDIADGQRGRTDAQRRAEIYNRGTNPFDVTVAKQGGGGVFFNEK